MLFPQRHNLYAADDTIQSTTTQTQEDNKGRTETEKPKLFTQEDLDRIAAKEKREGKQSAEKALLERLGASNEDEVKALLEAKRRADESAKSETERLTEALAQKDKELAEAKTAAANAEKLRLIERRDSALRSLLSTAHDVDVSLMSLQAKHASEIDALLDESGALDSKAAEKLVTEFKAKNAYLFKGDGKGSPSNAEGRLLTPQAEVQKEVAKQVGKIARI